MANLGHLILFQHSNFDGDHKHVINSGNIVGPLHDQTSSIVILDGIWEFFRDINFVDRMATLGVGDYPHVSDVGITHDSISSVRLVRSS